MASLMSSKMVWRTFDPVTQTVTLRYVEGPPVYSGDPTVTEVVILDTETTGLSESSQVMELYAGRYGFDAHGRCTGLLGSYHGLRDPSVPLEPSAFAVHGISMEDVRGKSLDLAALHQLIGTAPVFAFGARHDFNVMVRSGIPAHSWLWGDVLDDYDWRAVGFPSVSLAMLCACNGIVYHAHRAEPDVHATARLVSLSGVLPHLLQVLGRVTYILQFCDTRHEVKDVLRTQLNARWSAEQRLWYTACQSVEHLHDTYERFRFLEISGSTRVLTLEGSMRFDLTAITHQGQPWPV